VLGSTGRNIAAGMSGGIAYFLDLDRGRLNTELVDPHQPSEADLEVIHRLITRHHEETDSTVARRLLDDWETASGRFTKVLPRDYARVLDARTRAESEGLDEATTTTRMMEAANG
jgi:glutamate synthase (NADPH/NADH) large chain